MLEAVDGCEGAAATGLTLLYAPTPACWAAFPHDEAASEWGAPPRDGRLVPGRLARKRQLKRQLLRPLKVRILASPSLSSDCQAGRSAEPVARAAWWVQSMPHSSGSDEQMFGEE